MSDDDNQTRSDLQDFGDRLAKARGEEPGAGKVPSTSTGASAGDGMRVAIEFVVSVLVGSGLGYTIGHFMGSAVLGLVIGLPFGFAAGLRTVYRGLMAGQAGASENEGKDERGTD